MNTLQNSFAAELWHDDHCNRADRSSDGKIVVQNPRGSAASKTIFTLRLSEVREFSSRRCQSSRMFR